MKIDLYTKAVLTVIAVCLLCLVFRDQPVVPSARAGTPEITDVNIVRIAGYDVGETRMATEGSQVGGTLPVTVTNK